MRAMVAMAAAAAFLLSGCSNARTPAASQSWQAQSPAAEELGAPRAYARTNTTARVQARPAARPSAPVAAHVTAQVTPQALEYRAAGSMALAAPSLPGDAETTVGAGAADLGSPDGPVGMSAQPQRTAPRSVGPRSRAAAHQRPAAPCPPLRLPFCFGGT